MGRYTNVDAWRKAHLAIAEWIDMWRIIPRLVVAGYAYVTYRVLLWYMHLKPFMIVGCDVSKLADKCIAPSPSMEHAALVTAVVGMAAVVFGLYTNSSKKWDNGFTPWNTKQNTQKSDNEGVS